MYPKKVIHIFREIYRKHPQFAVKAPGRINLIGEHTDYNGGFVLPASIDKAIYFAISLRQDRECHIFAENLNTKCTFSVDEIENGKPFWAKYFKGVICELQNLGKDISGFNLVFGGDIPHGAGVSSSAALECGFVFALNHLLQLNLTPLHMAQIAQAAENNFVGVKCGIMDQFASMFGKEKSVIKLDCRSLEYAYYPFELNDCEIILCDTTVKHNLSNSSYNTRRMECETGVSILQKYYPQVQTLRDVSIDMLYNYKTGIPDEVFKRCLYVVQEIQRVNECCDFLSQSDMASFGEKMYETHDGLRHLYEVSCDELDFLVDDTENRDYVIGSRLMGGGFGGCTINLVHKKAVSTFIEEQTEAYRLKFDLKLNCHIANISNGVAAISIE